MGDRANAGQDIDERFKTLVNNATAARVVSQAVEGTIGPKGLDTMLVDSFGDVVITNDGITILKLMEINHPAAQMIINAAHSQQEEVGDGTTTATIMAAAMITEGLNQVLKGVPVTRLLEGIAQGAARGVEELRCLAQPVAGLDDPRLFQTAMVAGRGDRELAELILKAAAVIGAERMEEVGYRFADSVSAFEGGASEVIQGVLLNSQPLNRDMPARIENARILVVDDALKPEDLAEGALRTELGLTKHLELQEAYRRNLIKLVEMGVNTVLVHRSADDLAEAVLTDAGVMLVQRVSYRDMERVCEHTGARTIRRSGLNRDKTGLERFLGQADLAEHREDLEHIRIIGGAGQSVATVLVGAATSEVVEERERMARDAAAAVQNALRSGVVPGGGAIEVWTAAALDKMPGAVTGMSSFGIQCVREALQKPFACIMSNAGHNPLDKLVELTTVQQVQGSQWGIDCDNGKLADMTLMGIWDPAGVKIKALEVASEVARAVLRINTVIKKRESSGGSHPGELI